MYFSTGPTSRSSSHSLVSLVSSSSSSSSFTHFCVAVPVPVPSALFEVSPAVAAVEAVGYHSLPSLYTLPLPHDIVAVCLSLSLSFSHFFSPFVFRLLSLSLLSLECIDLFTLTSKHKEGARAEVKCHCRVCVFVLCNTGRESEDARMEVEDHQQTPIEKGDSPVVYQLIPFTLSASCSVRKLS